MASSNGRWTRLAWFVGLYGASLGAFALLISGLKWLLAP
jgi:hypothetical protein